MLYQKLMPSNSFCVLLKNVLCNNYCYIVRIPYTFIGKILSIPGARVTQYNHQGAKKMARNRGVVPSPPIIEGKGKDARVA